MAGVLAVAGQSGGVRRTRPAGLTERQIEVLRLLARGMTAWAQLFGTLSFELFGRLTNAVSNYEAYFDHQLRSMAAYLGI